MNFITINRIIRQIIREETGMPANSVRPSNFDNPTDYVDDNSPFATVLIVNVEQDGHDSYSVKDSLTLNKVDESVAGVWYLTLSIQFYRADAYINLCQLKSKLQLESCLAKFRKNGLGYIDSGNVINSPIEQNAFWEERAQMDLIISIVSTETGQLDTYGTFPISTNFENETITTSEVFEP